MWDLIEMGLKQNAVDHWDYCARDREEILQWFRELHAPLKGRGALVVYRPDGSVLFRKGVDGGEEISVLGKR